MADLTPREPIAQATLDEADRLTSADPMLAALNARAGGGLGEPLALPQLAAVPRLARRLGVAVSRQVLVADEDGDLTLRVHAEPADGGTSLTVSGWHEAATRSAGDLDVVEGRAGWRWETDAAMRLTSLPPGMSEMLGRPLDALFGAEGGGELLLDTLAHQVSVEGQRARLVTTGASVLLSVAVRTGINGAIVGLSGIAEPLSDRTDAVSGPLAGFLRRLDVALRAPLARIVANADSIAAQADGPVGSDYASYAADIASAGRHLMGLVDDLADLEAVERGSVDLTLESLDLADAAARAAGLLAVKAANAGVTVIRPAGEAVVLADFRRTLQILVNLIGNALRYSPPDGTVTLSVASADDREQVIVADQGKGIAPADQARIFDKFERVDPTEPGGSGLGLYIARRLARAMGGDLTVESTPGQGARFTLALPAAR